MPSLDQYVVLGFDYRVAPSLASVCTVDALTWEQAEDVYDQVLAIGCRENAYQLLDCDIGVIEENIKRDSVAIAIAVSPVGFSAMERVFGEHSNSFQYSTSQLIDRGWRFIGFDVADVDGFFSVFGIDRRSPKLPLGEVLFATELEADALVATASALYPSHAPFAIFTVFSRSAGKTTE